MCPKQLFVGLEIRDFRLSRISHLRSRSKWGFWAARTKSVVAYASQLRTELLSTVSNRDYYLQAGRVEDWRGVPKV